MCSECPDYVNIGFLRRWGVYACPQCLPSDIVPIRSWTWKLRPPDIRHSHLTYHTIPYHTHYVQLEVVGHDHLQHAQSNISSVQTNAGPTPALLQSRAGGN